DSTNDTVDPVNVELNITNSKENSTIRFERLTEFLKSYISDIRIKEENGNQITYTLIDDVEHTKIFPKMFADLDNNRHQYHIQSYGLSNSTLEQVFLRVADEIKRPKDYKRLSYLQRMKVYIKRSSSTDERCIGISYLAIQLSGLFIKRFHRTKLIKLAPDDSNPPPLILHPW
ncbi:unnamed protein product, partial [Rotaria sp. Silwood2]